MIWDETIERKGLGCKEKYFKFVEVRFDEFLKWDFQLRISFSSFSFSSKLF